MFHVPGRYSVTAVVLVSLIKMSINYETIMMINYRYQNYCNNDNINQMRKHFQINYSFFNSSSIERGAKKDIDYY